MKSSKQKYHIGCSGFYNTDWKGSLYPEDSQNKDFLKLYSKTYNTVEITVHFTESQQQKHFKNGMMKRQMILNSLLKSPKLFPISVIRKVKKMNVQIFVN